MNLSQYKRTNKFLRFLEYNTALEYKYKSSQKDIRLKTRKYLSNKEKKRKENG